MNSSNVVSKPTSLKLPAALKTQLESDAQRAGLSLHAYMVQTLADSVRVDSTRKLSQVSASNLSHWFKGIFGYLDVDKSTSVPASWAPFLGFCRTDLVGRT